MPLTATKKSPPERSAKKQASLDRARAFRARYKEYHDTKDREMQAWEAASVLRHALDQTAAALDVAREAAQRDRERLLDRIVVLKTEIEGLPQKHRIDELALARTATSKAFFAEKDAMEKSIDARFPDVAGVFSAAQWRGAPSASPEVEDHDA